jgi:hypothetical protein
MAKAELDILLDKLSGRLTGESKFYTTLRHGKTIISNYPLHRDPKNTTAGQRANSNAFGQAVKLCKAEMNDPEKLAYWTARYEAYKKEASKNLAKANVQFFGETNGEPNVPADKYYITLRGFIIGQLRVRKEEKE